MCYTKIKHTDWSLKGRAREELVEALAEYINQDDDLFLPEEHIKLIKVRLSQINRTWKEFFGILKEEDVARLPKSKLHLLADEIRFSEIEIRRIG